MNDVRDLALALPDVTEKTAWGNDTWRVDDKMFVWDRPLRAKERAELGDAAPEGEILGIYTGDLSEKEALLAAEPDVYFTIDHFADHPRALVRLSEIDHDRLAEIVEDAWLARAPRRMVDDYLKDRT